MHTIDLGTFAYGDETDQEIALVNQDGEAFDLAGATAIALECVTAGRQALSLAATASEPHAGIVTVPELGTAAQPTAAQRRLVFVGQLKWTWQSETYYSRDRVKFTIELFP